MNSMTLFERVSIIKDARQTWKVNHSLSNILLVTVCGMIADGEGWKRVLVLFPCIMSN